MNEAQTGKKDDRSFEWMPDAETVDLSLRHFSSKTFDQRYFVSRSRMDSSVV